ncbi:YdcH family protein [Cupriavidus campinensis]
MDENLNTLARQIIELQIEHRDLDYLIDRLSEETAHDELQLRRLKKRRLKLKDAITLLQVQLEPDVPA